MPSTAHLLTLAAATSAAATFQGFNYGAQKDGGVKNQADYESAFLLAQNLPGTNGAFDSARIFTTRQGATTQPIEAIPAAIKTKTSLLLGLWASAGQTEFNNEIEALANTAKQYCPQLDGMVAGISVGSEDLYRNSETSANNFKKAGKPAEPGAHPDVLVSYIKKVRETVKGTCLEKAPIGHVDTWDAYTNETNKAVIDAVDWIGADEYPFYESEKANSIENGKSLFDAAINKIRAHIGDKELWITETGWPVVGEKSGQAVASVKNAQKYYRDVACGLYGKMNVWWYILQAGPDGTGRDFGVVGADGKPLFDLSCDKVVEKSEGTNSTTTGGSKPSATGDASSDSDSDSNGASGSGSGSGSGSNGSSGSNSGSGPNSGSASNGSSGSGSGSSAGGAGGNGSGVAGSAQPTGVKPGSGGQSGGSAGVTPTPVPASSSSKLNSLGAAAIALVLTVAML